MIRRRKNRGMTLLEVLVALAVFGLTGGAIVNSVMSSLNNVSSLEEMYFAEMVANNVLAEQVMLKKWPNNSWITDKVELADRTWYFRYRGQSTMDANFKSLEVEVFTTAQTSTATPIVALNTYVSR
ncbi:MAG: type II secretion system minor pseudopilin GspI [Succinivibrionaceae bacterium]|nr:type II secretion system minor pseudopilin GspI [Ruminobacter sp.]MEE1339923.1 type II secretion system minor pseudopilin GspI [Succinivibrionaceae bacterium]